MRRTLPCWFLLFVGLLSGGYNILAALPSGIVDTQPGDALPPTPKEALELITVPEGFHVSLFAGDPVLAQPIAINYDERGRLWVAESFSYIEWKRTGKDRIQILEDTDNDGEFDTSRTFWDSANHLSGFQVGHGGVWVADAPELLFIPDRNRDDIPDGPPEVVLDGWTLKAEHNMINGLTWGPDGWLYGRHGIKQPSLVGKPGDPDEKRVPLSCSIWRYHPVRKVFEVVADGTINPWGLDWNEEGEAFITTSVIDHLWHLVPGAHFARWDGRGMDALNPYAYDLMRPTSDHRHWLGGETERRQQDGHGDAGGGHSHCGLLIYQSDAWPEAYRNRALFSNVLGQRINMDHLARSRSGYVAMHGEDLLLGNNPWFRAVDLKQGPMGEVMVAEWTDLGECHDRDGIHRSSGRLFEVWHGERRERPKIDVGSADTGELLTMLWHENVWWRRMAIRILHERAVSSPILNADQVDGLVGKVKRGSVRNAVTALQALHVTGNLKGELLRDLYLDALNTDAMGREAIRSQLIGLAYNEGVPSRCMIDWLSEWIPREPSGLVLLKMASALQRIPVEARWKPAVALADKAVDPEDRNLVLMRWYAWEPLVASDRGQALVVAIGEGHPYLTESIARRAVAAGALEDAIVVMRTSGRFSAEMLSGILEALPSKVEMPKGWKVAQEIVLNYEDAAVRNLALRLSHRFGDREASLKMLEVVSSTGSDPDERREFLQLLVDSRFDGLPRVLPELVEDPILDEAAIRAMAVFPRTASAKGLVGKVVAGGEDAERLRVILETLASRKDYSDLLVAAVLDGRLDKSVLPSHVARQLLMVSSKGKELASHLGMNAGEARAKEKTLATWRNRLKPDYLAKANLKQGREIFQRICATCHKLYGEGGAVGPDLTGSGRHDLDYLLINVLFPSDDVSQDYRMVTLDLADGRVLSGTIASENPEVIVLRQIGQEVRVDVKDVEARQVSELSIMPPGIIDALNRDDVRDLIGYLQTREDVE